MLFMILFCLNVANAQSTPGAVFEHSKNGQVDVNIDYENDSLGPRTGGDDYGHTYGGSVSAGRDFDGLYAEIRYNTDLFTKVGGPGYVYVTPDGSAQYDLYFTESNAIQIFVDNINKGDALYWRVGAGWIELNSESGGNILSATGQQEFLHRFIRKFDKLAGARPVYLPDGTGVRSSYEAIAALGLQNDILFSDDRFRLHSTVEIEGAKRGFKNADSMQVKAETNLYYQKNSDSVALKVGANTRFKKHDSGVEKKYAITAGVGQERWAVEAGVERALPGNKNENFVNYNTGNENMYTLQVKTRWGRPKK